MTHRLLAPASGASVTLWSGTAAEAVYAAAGGSTLDVPDNVATQLLASGFLQVGAPAGSGATSARPTFVGSGNAGAGTTWLDTTLNAAVLFDGATWRNPATGAAV